MIMGIYFTVNHLFRLSLMQNSFNNGLFYSVISGKKTTANFQNKLLNNLFNKACNNDKSRLCINQQETILYQQINKYCHEFSA